MATTYCPSVLSLPLFRTLAIAVALAVASCGLLPAPHLHTAQARSIVHQHAIAAPSGAHDSEADDHDHAVLDHGDHATAGMLSPSYDINARFTLAVATTAVLALAGARNVATLHHLMRTEILPTHDPPLRFTSSPAPPAVV